MLASPARPSLILGLIWTLVGAVVGGRMAGRRSADATQLAGLLAGVLMAVGLLLLNRDFSLWMALHIVVAIAGGWLGGFLAGRRQRGISRGSVRNSDLGLRIRTFRNSRSAIERRLICSDQWDREEKQRQKEGRRSPTERPSYRFTRCGEDLSQRRREFHRPEGCRSGN